jgi:hypothetical protein
MTACGAVGALMVGGRVVGQLRCEREAGHEGSTEVPLAWRLDRPVVMPGTPHRAVLEWAPEADPDLDLFDPDERFDVDVTLGAAGPLCEVETCVRHAGHEGLHDDIVPD